MNHYNAVQFQPKAWSILSRSFDRNRVASTYLFHGPEGVGHWPMAIAFTALLNCLEPATDEKTQLTVPCGQCRNCRGVFSLNFEGLSFAVPVRSHKNRDELIDLTNEFLEEKRQEPFKILVSKKATSLPIQMARDIKQSFSRKGTEGLTRVALFYQMEKMKAASADALLKLIEEPPPNTVILLTAAKPDRLLPTIQSRSQSIRLDRISENLAVEYLQECCDADKNKAQRSVRVCQGNLGRAIAMCEDEDDGDASRRAVAFMLFKALFTEPNYGAVSTLVDLTNPNDRSAAQELLDLWQSFVRDCTYFAATGDGNSLINIDVGSELERLSHYFQDAQLSAHMADCLKNALADLYLNVHIQTALVALVLKLKSRIPVAG